MILPPIIMEEQIVVQREIKARTILLQSLPEDHMADFHHLDDAKDIWLVVKARFRGNEESKKMRKSMLKQEFADFKISKSEGLHKGYDRFQKVLSQLNQMQARPDNEDSNMNSLELYKLQSATFLLLINTSQLRLASVDVLRNVLENDPPLYMWDYTIIPTCDAADDGVSVAADVAKIDKMNDKGKLEESNARFDKWKESSKNLVKLINSSMSSRSKFGLGYGDTFGSDEVFDLSAPSIFDLCLKDAIEKPLYDRFVKAGGLHAVPGPITGTFMPPSNKPDIDDTQFTYGSKSNNYSESNSVSNDFVSCDNSDKSSDSETTGFASCTSSVNSSSTMTNAPSLVDFMTLSKTADQRLVSINDDPSFSFKENVKPPRNLCNKSGINSRSLCKRKSFGFKTCFVCSTSVLTGSRNRSTSIPADRPFPAGWKDHATRPITRPSSHYFQRFSRPGSYNQMNMDGGRWGTAIKPSAGIVDSGCSRSMTGNKEKLADFVKIKGGTVTFGGGDGKITGKGTIRTFNFNFENVYYVEELQNFNLFSVSQICDTKNKVLFTDSKCLVLSKESLLYHKNHKNKD
ncbi:hypothetical protein Tco_0592556 [Tanacetum coccineum]